MKRFVSILAGTVVAIAILTGTAFAGEKADKGDKPIKGTVAVVKDGDAVKSITLTTAEGKTIEVVLDDNGKKLAEMDKKEVMVKGKEVDGKITVLKCHEAKKGKDKEKCKPEDDKKSE